MMSENEIFQQIASYLGEQFAIPVESIALETSFVGDLKADSLRLIEMAMHVEESLGVRVEDADVRTLESVRDVVRYVADRLAEADGGPARAAG
jgi:acyl carrier protein